MFPRDHPSTREILLLYRRVRSQHRRTLPWDVRQLGDEYVAAEFRRLRDYAVHERDHAQYQRAAQEFMGRWREYLRHLAQGAAPGRDLDERERALLSAEQQGQLERLRHSVHSRDMNQPR